MRCHQINGEIKLSKNVRHELSQVGPRRTPTRELRGTAFQAQKWRPVARTLGSIFAASDPEESKLHRYRELGVERVVLGVGREDVDVKEKVLPFLDRYAKLIPKLA